MITDDDDVDEMLRGRFRNAVSELSREPRRPQRHQSSPHRLARRLPAAAILLAALALVAVPAYAAGRASTAPAAGSSGQVGIGSSSARLAPTITVQKAISEALSERQFVQRVTRIDVKLVTFKDFYRVWSAGVTGTGACDQGSDKYVVDGEMYVVAMSGDFLTPGVLPQPSASARTSNGGPATTLNSSAFTTTHWAAIYIPAVLTKASESGPRFEIANAGNTANWPPCFDQLTSLSR